MMRVFRRISLCAAVWLLLILVRTGANAQTTYNFTSTLSGSAAQVPIDLDGTNNCTTVNGIVTCPADSDLFTGGGTITGGPEPGQFTNQSVTETIPVSGTGCSVAPGSVKGCSIGSVTNGCLYQNFGGNVVNRQVTTGDLLFAKLTSGKLCINIKPTLPWNFTGNNQFSFIGGTGKFAGATGSGTVSFKGQILQSDPQGHGMSWDTGSITGTITVP
jgi:hypothetical protein